MFESGYKIIDISQPIDSNSACFPGDVPFSKQITVSYQESNVINLTAMTMSPHVGTHADSPVHIKGDMSERWGMADGMPLEPYLGPVLVLDVATISDAITLDLVKDRLSAMEKIPPRILFRTTPSIRYDRWEGKYAYFSADLIQFLASHNCLLMGIDTPSVDHVESKDLPAHNALLAANMSWLENLDLTQVSEGEYVLVALPLKLRELEASPVRAVLLAK
jgi:arylformamidase